MKKGIGLVGLLLVIGIGGVGVSAMSLKNHRGQAYVGQSGKIVEVKCLEQGNISESLSVLGTLVDQSKRSLFIETNDVVASLPLRVGDYVAKGEVVATFEGEGAYELQRQIEQMDLQIENANLDLSEAAKIDEAGNILTLQSQISENTKNQTDLEEQIRNQEEIIRLAKEDYEDFKEQVEAQKALYESGALSKKEYEAGKLDLKQKAENITHEEQSMKGLEAQKKVLLDQKKSLAYSLNKAQNVKGDASYQRQVTGSENQKDLLLSKKRELQEKLKKVRVELTAPMEGWISNIEVSEGESVTPSMPILTLVGNRDLVVKVDLSPEDATYVEVGQTCTIDYLGKTEVNGIGRVSRVAPSVRSETKSNGTVKKTLPIEIELSDLSQPLKDGMEVDVAIHTLQKEGVIVVPKVAILSDQIGSEYVYLASNGKAVKTPIIIEEASKEEVVATGLNEGDYLIMSGLEELEEGQNVRYIP